MLFSFPYGGAKSVEKMKKLTYPKHTCLISLVLVISEDTNFFTSVHRTNASKIMMIEIDHIFSNNNNQIKSSICILYFKV
jgi:hypothetical protein